MPYSKLQLAFQYIKYLTNNQTLINSKLLQNNPGIEDFYKSVFGSKQKINSGFFSSLKNELNCNQQLISYKDLGSGENRNQTISSIYSRSSKRDKHLNLLFRLSKYLKPENTVEIGTSLGLSSLILSMGHPGNIYTFEGIAPIAKQARLNFDKALMDNIQLIEGNFDDTFESFLNTSENIDLFFFDGNHYLEPTLRYFEWALNKSKKTTVMIFDDINWSKEMQEAWSQIMDHPSSIMTIDIFYLGIVFLDDRFGKGNFRLRY